MGNGGSLKPLVETCQNSHLVVAAFDLGTTYSGYAFSFCKEPLNITVNKKWIAGTEELISLKAPTVVLLNPDGKFASFGYQAENQYADLAEENKHHGWKFFRHFKMMLYDQKALSRDTTIKDIQGNESNAKTIFSMVIRFLRDHLLYTLNNQTTRIEEKDILYVITVPAIWDDSAKRFMREAAEEAGIEGNRLKLALEPEAASLWYQKITDDIQAPLLELGRKYIVVDLGGGTADITVHERLPDGKLKELHKASGGPWGGTSVDKKYLKLLENIFGTDALRKLQDKKMSDYFDIVRCLEIRKRSISIVSNHQITVRIPAFLRELAGFDKTGRTIEKTLEDMNLKHKVTVSGEKLRIESDVFREWFEQPVSSVIDHVRDILKKPEMEGVEKILLVGGFGDSEYVQERFKTAFPNNRVIVPPDADLAILKGAVVFGHNPRSIVQRVMNYSYGICVTADFNSPIHPETSMVLLDGKRKARNVFYKFVSAGQTIASGKEVTHTFVPNNYKRACIKVYRSKEPNPKYTTDEGCEPVGSLIIESLLIVGGKVESLEDKMFDITFVFGDTELTVKARVRKTGSVIHTSIDCLTR